MKVNFFFVVNLIFIKLVLVTIKTNKMEINEMFILKGNGVTTKDVFFKFLGYELQGKKCFAIWSKEKPEKSMFTASQNFINKNLIKL